MHILIMILLISILIIVHEAGHFLAARMFKIKVEKFAIGLPFGPTLYEKQFGDTTFLIHACLFGGYVSFPDDDKDNKLPKDSPALFNNKPVYQRAIVVSAGVLANVVCALILVLYTAFVWGKLPMGEYALYIDDIVAPKGASVYSSGLQKNDKIYKVNGIKIKSLYELSRAAYFSRTNDGHTTNKIIAKNLEKIYKLNDLKEYFSAGEKIFLPLPIEEEPLYATRDELIGLKKLEADKVVLTDDEIKLRDEIKGKNFFVTDKGISAKEIATAVSDTYKPLTITVLRDNKEIELNPIAADKDGIIGIQNRIEEVYAPTTSIKTGFVNSYKYLTDNTIMMIEGLVSIFTGQIPMKDLHGIVAITKIGGNVIENQGIYKGLLLTAIISLNLAIVNFLPIPALDGGHLLFMFIEKITGRKFEEKTLETISNAGFYFLLGLMILVLFNDIWALITKAI